MNKNADVKRFLEALGGEYKGTRIFVANNSLSALKFIISLKDFSFRKFGRNVFEFYGIQRPSDRKSESKYLEHLSDYKEVHEEDTVVSFKNPKILASTAAHFGCEFLWPGWGHSSEDPELPRECASSNVVFLGPSSESMEKLGGKISANSLADACGIASIPWREIESLEGAKAFSKEIGYPVMVKTPEGGGGKGIRLVWCEDTLEESIKTAKTETGSKTAFVTKYFKNIRHIELQMLGDLEGDVEVVSTRDCTLQRRNQKLVEEGPASLTDEIKILVSEKAKKLVTAAKYASAGTIEFIQDVETGGIYFLEANPRLQVEHTVSELLTGMNLCSVQWMLGCGVSLASLRKSGHIKKEIEKRHVVGARMVAECAETGFTPSTGTISVSASFPAGCSGYFSVDHGHITPYSDSQFGHVFGVGETREEAVRSLQMVLSSIRIEGSAKNLNRFLLDLVESQKFCRNAHNTGTAEEFRKEWVLRRSGDPFYLLCFVAICMQRSGRREELIMFRTKGVEVAARGYRIDKTACAIQINGGMSVLEVVEVASSKYRIKNDRGVPKNLYFSQNKTTCEIMCNGKTHAFEMGAGGDEVRSPVSGQLVRFLKTGRVAKDEEYVEIESMKNVMRFPAPREGELVARARARDFVEEGEVIAEIRSAEKNESVLYRDKVEYSNTPNNYTMKMFGGYAVPEKLWSYEEDTIIEVLMEYVRRSRKGGGRERSSGSEKMDGCLDGYIAEALRILVNRAPDGGEIAERGAGGEELGCREDGEQTDMAGSVFAVFCKFFQNTGDVKNFISSLKYAICRKNLLGALESAAALEKKVEEQENKTRFRALLEKIEEHGPSYLENEECAKISQEVVVNLFFSQKTREAAMRLWAKKAFGKDGTYKIDTLYFAFGGMSCAVTTNREKRHAEGLLFYAKKEDAPDLQGEDTVTNITARADFSLHFSTYQRGNRLPLYDEIDPILVERLRIENIPNAALFGVFWNRRVFVYLSHEGQQEKAHVQCVLSASCFVSGPAVFEVLMEEIRSAYMLTKKKLPFSVTICITEKICITESELLAYSKKHIVPATAPIEEYEVEEVFIRGTITPLAQQVEAHKECRILSPTPEESPFVISIFTNRGFKESSLFIRQDRTLYTIDTMEIASEERKNEMQPALVPSPRPAEAVRDSRRKAKSLNTLYIYDFISLVGILLQDLYRSVTISELLASAPSCGMKGWRVSCDALDFILVGNDITQNSGAFSIEEDVFFSRAADLALAENTAFVYVSSNSGAKIGVMEALKPLICYDEEKNVVYISEKNYGSFSKKDQIKTAQSEIKGEPVHEIEAIFGEYGMGVENLSYSAEIARQMARMYEAIPTLTYVTGRAVGIGAYLARLGGRVVQKSNSPIILTGYQALNKLLQKEMYSSNIDIGGPDIMARNGVVGKTVETDTQGALEIIKWVDYVATQRRVTASPPSPSSFFFDRKDSERGRMEVYNSEEIVEALSDKDSFTEYAPDWAPNVRAGRMKMNGVPCGVIFPRSGAITTELPSTEGRKTVLWTENVLFPETSKKIAQFIEEFSREGLNILLFAHWRGFTATHLDMFEGVLQHGSEIVRSMGESQRRIFVYIGPGAELRGGSWVVFDKRIAKDVFLAAHPTAAGSVIQPQGLAQIKFRPEEAVAILERSQITPTKNAKSQLSQKFCSLHDGPERMLKMKVIDEIVTVSNLKEKVFQYFTRKQTSAAPTPPPL